MDWLVLGKPKASYAAAREPRLRGRLSPLQRTAVDEFAKDLDAVCRPGETHPFSGSGNKISSLRAYVDCLHGELGYGRSSELAPQEAQLLTAQNMSLPALAAKVDLVYPLVPHEVEHLLATPGVFRMCACDEPSRLHSLFVNVESWLPAALVLCEAGLLMPINDRDVPRCADGRHLCSGLFGVKKSSGEKLRIIVDRRRMNSCEHSLREVLGRYCAQHGLSRSETEGLLRLFVLPHPEQFKELFLTDESLPLGKDQCCGLECASRQVPSDLLEQHGIGDDVEHVSFCLRAPAMGAKQSTELAQCVHQCVLQQFECPHGAVQTSKNWLSLGWPPPCDNEWCGAYIDDLAHVCVVATDVPDYPAERSLRLVSNAEKNSTHAYASGGFIVKPEKCKQSSDQAKIWGGLLNSSRGDLGGPPDRMSCLAEVTRLMLLAGKACPRDVERVLGLWTHFLAFFRPSMSLFSDTYTWVQQYNHDPWLLRRIPPSMHDEFVGAMVLWPWCRTQLRACLTDVVVATDATLAHAGVAVASVTPDQAVSIWSRQRWRKGILSFIGEGFPDEELFVSSAPMEADQELEHAIQS
eukprot:1141695-Amphidinium_carterae.1